MTTPLPRPPSPWTGSQFATRHRWQLDNAGTLSEAAAVLRGLADELETAHHAGWWLTEPVRNGHLLAERASRRRRPGSPLPVVLTTAAPTLPPWRLRLVDEPPGRGDRVLDLATTAATPVVAVSDAAPSGPPALQQVSGPHLPRDVLSGVVRQVSAAELGSRRWAVARARLGPSVDLVAEGSALRVHAVEGGALVRTHEALTFAHAADRAESLPAAAAAYRRLAAALDAADRAGGRLDGVDDGLLHVAYPCILERTFE